MKEKVEVALNCIESRRSTASPNDMESTRCCMFTSECTVAIEKGDVSNTALPGLNEAGGGSEFLQPSKTRILRKRVYNANRGCSAAIKFISFL
mgnify:CR=1 FL=1